MNINPFHGIALAQDGALYPAPTVDSLGLPTPLTVQEGGDLVWYPTYSGTVTSYNLDVSDIEKTDTSGEAIGSFNVDDGTTSTPTVTFSSSSGVGTFTIKILAGACQNGGTNNTESAESDEGSITEGK